MSYDDMPQKQARIEALREEKARLQKVRQTIAFYEANAASGKVKKAVLPQMAQQIQPAEGAKYSTNGAGKALDRGLMRWILGGGSSPAFTASLSAGPCVGSGHTIGLPSHLAIMKNLLRMVGAP